MFRALSRVRARVRVGLAWRMNSLRSRLAMASEKRIEKAFLRKIRPYRNRHLGEKCIIMGCGPSLNSVPPEVLDRFITFGVNRAYRKTAPDYMVLIDSGPSFLKEMRMFAAERSIPFFLSWTWGNLDQSRIRMRNEIVMPFVRFPVDYTTSEDGVRYRSWLAQLYSDPDRLELGVTSNANVIPEAAIPLALYMGFERIYLAGVDMKSTPHLSGDHFFGSTASSERMELYYERERKKYGVWGYDARIFPYDIIRDSPIADRIYNLNPDSAVTQLQYASIEDLSTE